MAAQCNNGSEDNEPRYIGPTQGSSDQRNARPHPRQYFPGEDAPRDYAGQQDFGGTYRYGSQPETQFQPETQYQPAPQYRQPEPVQSQQPAQPTPPAETANGGKGSGVAGVLGALLVLALLGLGVVTFLWRSAASEADKPAPAPETVTETQTKTPEKETVTETEQPDLSTVDPRDVLPSDVPDELMPDQEKLDELHNELDDLLGNLRDTVDRAGEPAN